MLKKLYSSNFPKNAHQKAQLNWWLVDWQQIIQETDTKLI